MIYEIKSTFLEVAAHFLARRRNKSEGPNKEKIFRSDMSETKAAC